MCEGQRVATRTAVASARHHGPSGPSGGYAHRGSSPLTLAPASTVMLAFRRCRPATRSPSNTEPPLPPVAELSSPRVAPVRVRISSRLASRRCPPPRREKPAPPSPPDTWRMLEEATRHVGAAPERRRRHPRCRSRPRASRHAPPRRPAERRTALLPVNDINALPAAPIGAVAVSTSPASPPRALRKRNGGDIASRRNRSTRHSRRYPRPHRH